MSLASESTRYTYIVTYIPTVRLYTYQINPDGHCLFSAIGDQLAILNIVPPAQAGYLTVRYAASHYIYTHPDDFLPFLPASDGGHGTGLMTRAEFERLGLWGGEPEILALSRAYNVPIHVIQGGSPPVVVHNPTGAPGDVNLWEKEVLRIIIGGCMVLARCVSSQGFICQ